MVVVKRLPISPAGAHQSMIRTTGHEGYAKSNNARRGIEKVFGWIKQFGGLRQFQLRGRDAPSLPKWSAGSSPACR